MVQSTPLLKYRETEGIQDCTGYTGGAGKGAIKEINYNEYIDNGNAQGCDAVKTYTFRDFPNYNDSGNPGKYPLHPTHPTNWTQLRYQKWNGEEWQTIGAVPSTWYDCSTWGTIGKTYLAVGAYATGGTITPEYSDPVTVLAQSGSTATQNFAFDIGDEEL